MSTWADIALKCTSLDSTGRFLGFVGNPVCFLRSLGDFTGAGDIICRPGINGGRAGGFGACEMLSCGAGFAVLSINVRDSTRPGVPVEYAIKALAKRNFKNFIE